MSVRALTQHSKLGKQTLNFFASRDSTGATVINAGLESTAENKLSLVPKTAGQHVKLENVADGTIQASSKDAVNGGQIDDLKTNLEAADTLLQSNIDDEATARASADAVLEGLINANTTSCSDNTTAISNEAAARAAADADLQQKIDDEEAARENADTILQNNINAEAATRASADAALDQKIDQKEGEAATARANLQSDITANANAIASNATNIGTNSGRCTVLEGKVSTLEGEMDAAEADIDALQTLTTSHGTSLTTNAAAIAQNAANIGLNEDNIVILTDDLTAEEAARIAGDAAERTHCNAEVAAEAAAREAADALIRGDTFDLTNSFDSDTMNLFKLHEEVENIKGGGSGHSLDSIQLRLSYAETYVGSAYDSAAFTGDSLDTRLQTIENDQGPLESRCKAHADSLAQGLVVKRQADHTVLDVLADYTYDPAGNGSWTYGGSGNAADVLLAAGWTEGERILVALDHPGDAGPVDDQGNGVFVVAADASLSRADDMDSVDELAGSFVFCKETFVGYVFASTIDSTKSMGEHPKEFHVFSQSGSYSFGNAFSVTPGQNGQVSVALSLADQGKTITTSEGTYVNPNADALVVDAANGLYLNHQAAVEFQDITCTSDIQFKENVELIENGLDVINSIEPVNWDWKSTGASASGVIAQQLEEVLPHLVRNGDHKSVNYNGLHGYLISAIQELSGQVKELLIV